jgi:mono/diheme cytochrome c family protein
MNRELRYIFKGVLYACVLFAVVYAGYYIISYEKNKTVKTQSQPPVITYDDLMNTPQISEGKDLFDKNCSSCHKIRGTDQIWLENIVRNNYDKKELYGWIRNSDSVIKSGNKYYNAMFDEFNQTKMTSFPNFSDKEIDEIIEYIKVERAP